MALTNPVTTERAKPGSRGQAWITRPMLITLALLLTFPLWGPRVGLYSYLGVEVVVWMIYALGFNLLLGYTGLPSFGHGAFFGVGAYAYGLCYLGLSQSPLLSLLCAGLAGGIAAAIVGCFLAHRRGIYFALMTIACGQVFWFVAMKWRSVTGGEDGLLNVHRAMLGVGPLKASLKDNVALFYFAVTLFAVCLVFLWRLVHSPFGVAPLVWPALHGRRALSAGRDRGSMAERGEEHSPSSYAGGSPRAPTGGARWHCLKRII